MSIVEELGAVVRTGSDELPLAAVTAAVERLRAGLDLLRWARQHSAHEFGTVQLAGAAEHLEQAGRALLAAQDQLATYLTAIGLAQDGTAAPASRPGVGAPPSDTKPAGAAGGDDQPPLADWWSERVAALTGTDAAVRAVGDKPPAGPTDPEDLLVRVADRVRAGDRAQLAHELSAVRPHVGLALAALAPTHAYQLAAEVLGHRPAAPDLDRLAALANSRIGALLPGLPQEVLLAQLARVCRATAPPASQPTHPADSAVTSAVLVGVLLEHLGQAGTTLNQQRDAQVR